MHLTDPQKSNPCLKDYSPFISAFYVIVLSIYLQIMTFDFYSNSQEKSVDQILVLAILILIPIFTIIALTIVARYPYRIYFDERGIYFRSMTYKMFKDYSTISGYKIITNSQGNKSIALKFDKGFGLVFNRSNFTIVPYGNMVVVKNSKDIIATALFYLNHNNIPNTKNENL